MRQLRQKPQKDRTHRQAGFTFIELLVVIGVIGVILSFALLNLRQAQNQASLNTVIPVIISDIKSQQVKSMSGYTDEGGGSATHGIYFDTNYYVLFEGSTYQTDNPNNFVLPLDENLRFESISFPNSQLVFSLQNGEVENFSEDSNTFSIKNTNDNEVQNITINQLGVITAVD